MARSGLGLLLPLLVLAALACERGTESGKPMTVASIDGQPIRREELQDYLKSNLVEEAFDADLPPGTMDDVKSRLLDSMIEERLLYAEAERQGVEVSDREVQAYLDMGASETPEDVDLRPQREEEARRRLMIQKLQEQVVREQTPPTEEEIEAYAAEHYDTLLPASPLELRALQMRSLKQAKRVYGEIRRNRMTFNEAVLAYEPSPGQAVPMRMSWDSVPSDLRTVLKKLKPGQVSEPLEMHGSIYLFQVGTWLEDPADHETEVFVRASEELEASRRRRALDALAERLRRAADVRINAEGLPFHYVAPAPDGF